MQNGVDHPGEQCSSKTEITPMGNEMRQKHFMFEEGFINLNHGLFCTEVFPAFRLRS